MPRLTPFANCSSNGFCIRKEKRTAMGQECCVERICPNSPAGPLNAPADKPSQGVTTKTSPPGESIRGGEAKVFKMIRTHTETLHTTMPYITVSDTVRPLVKAALLDLTHQGKDKVGVYAGLKYRLTITFPPDYPHKRPKLQFSDPKKIWHPNVAAKDGMLCDDFMEWAVTSNLTLMFSNVILLLKDPSLDSPLNQEAGQELKDNNKKFKKSVQQKAKS